MDGVQDRISVNLSNALPNAFGGNGMALPSARESALASRNRTLSSENSRLQGEVGQLRSENSGLKLDIRSLQQELQSQQSSSVSVPGYASNADKGLMIDAYV